MSTADPRSVEYAQGDRVYVTDPHLAQMRDIMRRSGVEPAPNHHGTVEEVWDDSVLIHFDDGGGAPYPFAEVRHLRTPPASTPEEGL